MDSQMCPVCTLYLRPGMTLQDHLHTHPKDQVIEALVRLAITPNPPPILSTPALMSTATVTPATAPATINTNSQFTAITYRQFQTLTTNVPEPNLPLMLNPCLVTPPPSSPFPTGVIRSSVPLLSYPYYTADHQQTSASNPERADNSQSVTYSFATQTTQTTETATPIITEANTVFGETSCDDIQDIDDSHEDYESASDPFMSDIIDNHQGTVKHDYGENNVCEIQNNVDNSFSCDKINQINNQPVDPIPNEVCDRTDIALEKDSYSSRRESIDKKRKNRRVGSEKGDRDQAKKSIHHIQVEDDQLIDTSHSLGTVISNTHRLIANDPTLTFDHHLRANNIVDEYVDHNYDDNGNIDSPESEGSNWSSGSGLRVRTDLSNLDETGNSCIHYVQPNSNAEEYVTSDPYEEPNTHRSAQLTDLDEVNYSMVLNYATNQQLAEMHMEDHNNKEDNSVHSVPINIHSDELMPPRGELSGQESLGATENSVWELQSHGETSTPSFPPLEKERWTILGSVAQDDLSLGQNSALALAERNHSVKCLECDMKFPCVKERRIHVQTVHKTPRHTEVKTSPDTSPVVKEDMSIVRDLTIRIKQEKVPANKTDPSARTCVLCNLELQSIKEFKKHKRELHEVKRKCATCETTFPDGPSYREHIAKVHPIECNICGKLFPTRSAANAHAKSHLKFKPFQCTVCDKSFNSRMKLTEHNNKHTGAAPYKCPLCSMSFRRHSNLLQHKNYFHLKIKKKIKDYFCHCGEIFHTIKKLQWHKEIHDSKPKQCMYCSERYIHSASLTRHIRHAHDSTYLPKSTRSLNIHCPICKITCIQSSLAQHMKIHSGDKLFTCNVCSKEFSTNWNLQMHKWTHASRSSKPYKCKLCKSAFYMQTSYQAHLRSHRNVRPYTCNYCGRQFIRKYNCVRHVKEHETTKTYCCSVCNKTFHRSYYLTEHMRTHTGVKPYTCHICSKTSSTKSNHNKHVRTHHAREPVNTEG